MKQQFITEDGETFDDEAKAQAHEEFLKSLEPADKYRKALEKAGHKGASVTRQHNAVVAFLTYQSTGKVAEPTPVVEKNEAEPAAK